MNSKTVYQLDENQYFLHSTEADRDPMNSDRWLIPSGCIEAEAPEQIPNKIAQWTGKAWQYQPDYRGQVAYHKNTGETVMIHQIGELPKNLTLKPKPDDQHPYIYNGTEWVLDEQKQAKLKAEQQTQAWENIKAERYKRTHSGVYLKSINKWFHTDEPSRIQYLSIQQLPEIPENLQWKTMDNSFVIMTKELLNQLLLTMIANEQADFANAEKHRQAMLKADDPLAYDYSTGWSEIY